MSESLKMEASWKNLLIEEFSKPYFKELKTFIETELQAGKVIYPPSKLIFNAFDTTPIDQVKIVILGQDPYHGPNQAMGLSFSVPQGVRVPPSLKNIYKELNQDLTMEIPNHGNLTSWATQGVFLLNAFLTVEQSVAGSHRKIGWHHFTDKVISTISNEKDSIVFMLWGNFARSKKELIDSQKHLILEAAHPSPLARGAFFGCRHFSTANKYLTANGIKPINWKL